MSKRRILTIGILALTILIVIYYSYMLFDTRRIMKELNKAICDENYSSEEPDAKYYLQERPREGWRMVSPAHRYFTWCWNGKGKIWMYCKYESTGSAGVNYNGDFPVVYIEKVEGKWIITGWYSEA